MQAKIWFFSASGQPSVRHRALPTCKSGIPMELKGTSYDADGGKKDGRAPKTGTPSKPIVPIPGQFFPADRVES